MRAAVGFRTVEDVGAVVVAVQNPFFVERRGVAGEVVEHVRRRLGEAEWGCGPRQGRVVRAEGREIAFAHDAEAVAALGAGRSLGRVDPERAQPCGVFVGAACLALCAEACLALAQKRVDDAVEAVGRPVPFHRDFSAGGLERFDAVATVMERPALRVETAGQREGEAPQRFGARVEVQMYGKRFSHAAWDRRPARSVRGLSAGENGGKRRSSASGWTAFRPHGGGA